MNNSQLTTDQCGEELSMDDLSAVNGGGPGAIAGWVVITFLTGGIAGFIDLANGCPWAKEAANAKY